MKANRHFIILAILLSYFAYFSEFGIATLSNIVYYESISQESCTDLQYAQLLTIEKDFENGTCDEKFYTCIWLTIHQLSNSELYSFCKKHVYVKQVWYSDKSSRSPPFI